MDELSAREAELARTSPSLAAAATAVIQATKGWVRANLDWSIETGRYRP